MVNGITLLRSFRRVIESRFTPNGGTPQGGAPNGAGRFYVEARRAKGTRLTAAGYGKTKRKNVLPLDGLIGKLI